MREVFDAREVGDAWKPERVGDVHGFIECVIVAATLGALHPVHDALALSRNACAADRYTCVLSQGA